MKALAAIHVAKKQLGLDDDTYRAVLVRITGKNSAGTMNELEREKVLAELRRQGFRNVSRMSSASKPLEGPYSRKLQALWIAAWNLGLVRDRRDSAMLVFVRRQTGIDHTRFLRNPSDARAVIEALKAWLARDAGVDWAESEHLEPWQRAPGARIALAQWAILQGTNAELTSFKSYCERQTSRPLQAMTARSWVDVMNRLGERLRSRR
ncbi:gp16 family protein [Nitratireductor rhodophyticola]